MEHPKFAPLQGNLLVIPRNIRLGRRCQPGTNTLAYYEHVKNGKSFITLAPGVNVAKHFYFVTDEEAI